MQLNSAAARRACTEVARPRQGQVAFSPVEWHEGRQFCSHAIMQGKEPRDSSQSRLVDATRGHSLRAHKRDYRNDELFTKLSFKFFAQSSSDVRFLDVVVCPRLFSIPQWMKTCVAVSLINLNNASPIRRWTQPSSVSQSAYPDEACPTSRPGNFTRDVRSWPDIVPSTSCLFSISIAALLRGSFA